MFTYLTNDLFVSFCLKNEDNILFRNVFFRLIEHLRSYLTAYFSKRFINDVNYVQRVYHRAIFTVNS